MEQSRSGYQVLAICVLLALMTAGCDSGVAVPSRGLDLRITSPQASRDMRGGGDLRIALSLLDRDGAAVEGALVEIELWHPAGELHASLSCEDRGGGSYVAEIITLPLRSSSGTWRITARATTPAGLSAMAEGGFDAGPSISEVYLEEYGFWVEYPRIFGLGTGFHNLHETGGLHFEDWHNVDGSSLVILDNYRYVALGITFATLEVHWMDQDFPVNAASAVAVAVEMARAGLHHQEPAAPLVEMSAQASEFQGRQAWLVAGEGKEFYVSGAGAAYPIEWLIFECPGSDWLWSLVIAADEADYLDHLRSVRGTFECPHVLLQ